MRSSAPSSAATRSIFGRTGTRPTGAFWPRICAIPRARNGKRALSENLTKQPLLRNFLHPLNREELDVGHRHPLGLQQRSEEHTSELQSPCNLVCRRLLEKKNKT